MSIILRERQHRPNGHVVRHPADDTAHRIIQFQDPRDWTMQRVRPQVSWLRHVETYLPNMGIAGSRLLC